MVCRVCLENVKKTAVLCAKCSLISHSKCAPNAPQTCDFRSQLLLYAHYAEQGSPRSLCVNPPSEHSEVPRASVAISDVSHLAHHTPRTSIDIPASQSSYQISPSQPNSPSTASKLKAVFKRSWSSLTNVSNATSSPDPLKDIVSVDRPSDLHFDERTPVPRKRPIGLLQKSKERPLSYTSNSTGLASLRSAATTTESLHYNSATEARRLSQLSSASITRASSPQERDRPVIPKEQMTKQQTSISAKGPVESKSAVIPDHEMTSDFAELRANSSIFPGSLSHFRRKRESKNSSHQGNCIVQ